MTLCCCSLLKSSTHPSVPTLKSDVQEFETESKQMVARGRVELSHEDLFLQTETLSVDQNSFLVSAPESVRILKGEYWILGEQLVYNYQTRDYELVNLRFGVSPFYIHSSLLEGNSDTIQLSAPVLHFGEPDPYGLTIRAEKAILTDTQRLEVEGAKLYVGKVPVFYLPKFSQDIQSKSPVHFSVDAGYQKKLGLSLQTRTKLRYNPFFQYGLNLDGYSERGVLAGPLLEYENRVDSENWFTGNFDSGFLHDFGDTDKRGFDLLGHQVETFRFFNQWQYLQEINGQLNLTGQLSWWSDSEVLRDFREEIFDYNQQPDSFFEAVFQGEQYYLSAFARIQPNDFQLIGQRLPEIRLDTVPIEWFETGIYGRTSAGFVQLIEKDPYGNFDKRETGRFHAYYGLSRPTALTEWLTAMPVAGGHITHYTQTLSAKSDYTRLLGQIGLDLDARMHATWNYQNKLFKIDGLRHILKPSIQYRYIPEAESGSGVIPKIDRYQTFESYLVPIDLGDKRNLDDLSESNVIRIGLRNLLQTRHPEYGSIDLVELNVFQDVRFSQRTRQNDYSNLFTQLSIAPAYWLRFELFSRIDPESLTTREWRNRLRIIDGDAWSVFIGNDYVKATTYNDTFSNTVQLEEINQFVVGATKRLNERNTLRAELRVDANAGQVNEQIIAWKTRFSSSWDIEFQAAYRNGTAREDDFQFKVLVDLLTF